MTHMLLYVQCTVRVVKLDMARNNNSLMFKDGKARCESPVKQKNMLRVSGFGCSLSVCAHTSTYRHFFIFWYCNCYIC